MRCLHLSTLRSHVCTSVLNTTCEPNGAKAPHVPDLNHTKPGCRIRQSRKNIMPRMSYLPLCTLRSHVCTSVLNTTCERRLHLYRTWTIPNQGEEKGNLKRILCVGDEMSAPLFSTQLMNLTGAFHLIYFKSKIYSSWVGLKCSCNLIDYVDCSSC